MKKVLNGLIGSSQLPQMDLRKAYNTLEWLFLKAMQVELGFPNNFVGWVMEYISTVSYSLMKNSGLTIFSGQKRFEARGPHGPLPFCDGPLPFYDSHREIQQLELQKQFHFHPRYKRFNLIHMYFANDLLMFCRADMTFIILLQETFHKFSVASGLKATIEKSFIYMVGTSNNLKNDILQVLAYVVGI